MISSHKIKMDPSTTTRYAVQIHFDFFGSTEEGINYLHTNFERVFRGDTALTNICYCQQAHFEVEEKFEKIIHEGPQVGGLIGGSGRRNCKKQCCQGVHC